MSHHQIVQEQFKTRLGTLVKRADLALESTRRPPLAQRPDCARIVEQLSTISRRCALMHSLVHTNMLPREFDALQEREIEFLRSAERFLDSLRRQFG